MRRWAILGTGMVLAGCVGADEEAGMGWSDAFVIQGASVFDGDGPVGVQDVVVRAGLIHAIGSSDLRSAPWT